MQGPLPGVSDQYYDLPGVPWNPDSEKAALTAVKDAGWTPITAGQLGYTGKTDARGTFYGEKPGYTTGQAEILGKYDASGHLDTSFHQNGEVGVGGLLYPTGEMNRPN